MAEENCTPQSEVMAEGIPKRLTHPVKNASAHVVMSTIPKRKYKCSDIEANYRNETKTFWCVPKKEVERFFLVQKL